VKEVKLEQQISSISSDSKSSIYIGTFSGNLIRYDQFGEEDEYFSALNNSPLTTVQAWNRLKVFTFFREQQTFAILDRFATSPKTINLKDLNLQYARLFAPGIDNSFWALSTEFRELVKYDDQNLNVLFKIAIGLDMDLQNVSSLRAFKNLLIISDRETGLYIFDQFGTKMGQISEPNIEHIEIKEDKIYTTNGSEYLVIDPFTLQVIERMDLPRKDCSLLVLSGKNIVIAAKNSFFIYVLGSN
jgi:hypothetical protein